ncbi:FAD-dependent oxidoreductase [Akkermansiaceae bacterium]|nr:FAD-dependent oxidoreductase [Akkermansiaceae bacterium]
MNPSQSDPQHFLILGGGVCGIYAALTALRKGHNVTLIEKADHLGGLAAGYQRNENFYDIGVHMLHAFDKDIFTDIKNLMGDDRIEVPLDARIRWRKSTYKYPLKFGDLIKEMPKFTLLYGVSGLVIAEIKRAISTPVTNNAEEALIAFYGRPLYSFFFEEFTHKYWGIHPRELSAEFIKRKMPRLSAVDFFRKQLARFLPVKEDLTTESSLKEETLHYSRKGSSQMIIAMQNELEKLGCEILTSTEIQSINLEGKSLTLSDNREIQGDTIINTIPVNNFIALCESVPKDVTIAAKALKFKPIATYGLLINKPKLIDGLYIYYRNKSFHRLGEPKNAGVTVKPDGHSILIVESTCDLNDERWNATEEWKQKIIADLESESICKAEDIVEWHTITYPHAYPIFTLDFEKSLEISLDWIHSHHKVKTTGRQGAFTYPAMHNAMRMGQSAVEEIADTI